MTVDRAAACCHALGVLDREEEGEQQDPPADRGVEDRAPDALGGTVGRAVRLLGEVRRGVEPGDRVLGQQEAEREHAEPEPAGWSPPPKPRCC